MIITRALAAAWRLMQRRLPVWPCWIGMVAGNVGQDGRLICGSAMAVKLRAALSPILVRKG